MKAKKTKRVPPTESKSRAMRERPKMPPISEEMKQWSAMLKTEVSGWPQISTKPMFGMMGLYRGKKIFGGLPVTRGLDTPNSVIFRFDPIPSELEERASKDKRISPGKRWFSFDVRSTEDLRDALWWLNQAYERTK
jgi:luciferase-like monooxygenase